MIYKFTARAKKAIELAQNEAMALGHSYIGSEHILYGLIKEGAGVASRVIENQDITPEDVENKIIEIIDCYDIEDCKYGIKDILDKHDKILNTSGEKNKEEYITTIKVAN